MSGLVLIYSRALRKGDYVEVNGVRGIVTEVAALAIKVATVRNEEITIPNSVLVSSPIHNYSRMQDALITTTVTIGYDTPWRQVHAMLVDAARRTAGVRQDFEPYVYQRALSDFYVEYELFAGIETGARRAAVMSELHATIQDSFNEHGVQIMSPHFEAQPERAVVVPKAEWFKSPAGQPSVAQSK
jgi:small-conductance mechanosensitive channel